MNIARTAVPLEGRRRIALGAGGLLVALVAMAIFALSYVGALHKPKPHHLPIGVLDARAAAAIEASGGAFTARLEPSLAQLQRDLKERKIAAGFAGRTLYVASGRSYATSIAVTRVASRLVSGLRVVDVAPLQAGDPQGTSLFYLVVALCFGGYFSSTVVSILLGYGTHTHRQAGLRVFALAAFSVAAGLVGAAVVDAVYGAVTGHFLEVAGIGMLVTFAIAVATSAVQSALGAAGTLLAMFGFVILGNSSAGAAYESAFLPGFWRSIGPYMPQGAGLSALKGLVYFDGSNIGGRLVVLGVYAAIGAAVVVLVGWSRGPRAPELEVAGGAAAA